MPNQTDQSTLNMSKIGPAIASILILLIVIGYSIKTIKNQVRHIESLHSNEWHVFERHMTSNYFFTVSKFRDNSQSLYISQNGDVFYSQLCTNKLKNICKLAYSSEIKVESVLFYAQIHKRTGRYTSLHLKDIVFIDQNNRQQIFNYLTTPPDDQNSISNKKNSVWISLILIFISYLFFGSLASFQISDSIPQNIKMQKKINKTIILAICMCYCYLIAITLITFLRN